MNGNTRNSFADVEIAAGHVCVRHLKGVNNYELVALYAEMHTMHNVRGHLCRVVSACDVTIVDEHICYRNANQN